MYETKILCLANSRKPPSGRCIAGKVLVDGKIGEWLRPVSDRHSHGRLPKRNGATKAARRHSFSISYPCRWTGPAPVVTRSKTTSLMRNTIGRKKASRRGLRSKRPLIPTIRHSGRTRQSTYHGCNDKVAEADVSQTGSSLKLILVPALELHVRLEDGYGGSQGRRRVRAQFNLNGIYYLLSVTDPEVEETCLTSGEGCYVLGEAALCISLAEVWNGFAFRVVASVLTPERCQTLNA